MRRIMVYGLVALIVSGSFPFVHGTQPPQRGTDYGVEAWLSPSNPRVGDTYTLYISVYNNSSRYILFHARIAELPQGDRLYSSDSMDRSVGPGNSTTFRFDIYCGVLGGRVRYELLANW